MAEGALKRQRLAKSMTLKALSDRTGLSLTFLSELENGKGNPTLDTLRRIADGLGVSLFDILAEDTQPPQIVRRGERRVIRSSEYNMDYELIANLMPPAKSQLVMAGLQPGASTSDEPQGHGSPGSEEVALVLGGTVCLEIHGVAYTLYEGDSVRFDPSAPHKYANRGDVPVSLLAVMTPPSF